MLGKKTGIPVGADMVTEFGKDREVRCYLIIKTKGILTVNLNLR